MAVFIVPIIGDGLTLETARRPKYVADLPVQWASINFGANALCWANTTAPQSAALLANPDAIGVHDITQTVALNATRNALESINIPGNWIQAGMTYRQVMKVIAGIHLFLQRVKGRGVTVTLQGNLDKTISQLPASAVSALTAAGDDLELDRTGITGQTTVRELLRNLGSQFQSMKLGDL